MTDHQCGPDPCIDCVEAVGLDGTLRTNGGVPYTWEDLFLIVIPELWAIPL